MTEQSRARRIGRGTGLVLAGAVGATAITGIAFAQTGPGDESADAITADQGGGPGHGFGGPGTGPVLHGQDTVRTRDGEFEDILIQNGELTAVSASSITVRSEDGFTATYSITADTGIRVDRGATDTTELAVGRPARVIANVDSSAKLVASTNADGQAEMSERRQELRDRIRQWRQDGNGDDGSA